MLDLDPFSQLVTADHGLTVVTTRRSDLSPQSTVVNAGVIADPLGGDPAVAFVTPGSSRKLVNLRRDPLIVATIRAGWQWATVEGRATVIGPDDPHTGIDDHRLRRLLREIFQAAGGTHEDWDAYDQTMLEERRAAVVIAPTRLYTNPG